MRSVEVRGIHLDYEYCAGVYPPSDDTFLMLECINPSGKCLEIGCGTGVISLFMAGLGHEVVACDINQKAIDCTIRNAEINNLRVEAIHSDLFTEITGRFDTIVFNPPYLPTEDDVDESEQWDGGSDGFQITGKFLEEAQHFINQNGRIFLILSSLTDTESFMKKWTEYNFSIIGEKKFFFEKIFCVEIKKNNMV